MKIKELIALAQKAAYNVRNDHTTTFILSGKTLRSRGVMIFEDGTILRTDTDLNLSKKMTVSEAASFLQLSD